MWSFVAGCVESLTVEMHRQVYTRPFDRRGVRLNRGPVEHPELPSLENAPSTGLRNPVDMIVCRKPLVSCVLMPATDLDVSPCRALHLVSYPQGNLVPNNIRWALALAYRAFPCQSACHQATGGSTALRHPVTPDMPFIQAMPRPLDVTIASLISCLRLLLTSPHGRHSR